MHVPHPKRWKNHSETEGLLLFAQRIAESLFDYTLDSYKAPALNTHTRCRELLDAVSDIRKNGTPKDAIIPLYQELAWSIRVDSAAQALLGTHALHFSTENTWRTLSLNELDVHVAQIRSALQGRYTQEIIRQLRELIPVAKEKDKILGLTTSLVIEWVNEGYSKDYIFYRTRGFFFGRKGQKITGIADFDTFIQIFNGKTRDWSVTVRADPEFRFMGEVLPAEYTVVSTEPPPAELCREREHAFYSEIHTGVYVTLKRVPALDARAARDKADFQLERIANLMKFHVHQTAFAWSGDAIVTAPDIEPILLRPSTSPIHKEVESPLHELPQRLARTLTIVNPSRMPRESYVRLATVMNLHATALESDTIEAQLFGLWAGLESLLPLAEAESRIGRIVELTVPILARHYPRKRFLDLHHSLRSHISKAYDDVLRETKEGDTAIQKCAAVISIQENEPLRDKLYAAIKGNPLLRHRIFHMKKQFSSAETITDTLEKHTGRVSWHLRRIYRSRNLLVHTGRMLPYRETLVENLHTYIDRILWLLHEAFDQDPRPISLDAALLAIRLDHQAHMQHLLKNKKVLCTPENYMTLLYGPVDS
jgi:hypothetical protein